LIIDKKEEMEDQWRSYMSSTQGKEKASWAEESMKS